jgi:hypothetical protein
MKQKNLIPLKAMFLLIVFCMSTMVSFACVMGMEMGYNKNHHEEVASKASSTHQHGDSHEHLEKVKHQHAQKSTKPEKKTDDCCKKEAKKFAQFDKIVSKISLDNYQPILSVSFIQSFYSFDILEITSLVSVKSNLYRSHHPPIHNKLIAIQTFLI